MAENKYSVKVVNNGLVTWLKNQGADKTLLHDFVLEKGMGERMELQIINNDVVKITFYGLEKDGNTTN